MNPAQLLAHFNRISDAPDAIPRLRSFILDLGVRGKLVEQNTKDEPASKLIDRIEAKKSPSGVARGNTKLGASDEVPFEIPPNWVWNRLGNLCSKTGSGSTPRGGKSVYKQNGVPFIRSQNVYNDGLRLDEVAYISHQTHEKMSGTALEPGDLLLNITGGSIGRCCVVPSGLGEANVSQHVAIIRVAIDGIQCYLHKLILSPYFQSFVLSEQTGAGRGGLPKNRMDRIPVAVPPFAEQYRIVAKIDELMSLCDRLEAEQSEREARRDQLVAASHYHLNNDANPGDSREHAHFYINHFPTITTRPDHIKQLRQTVLNLAIRGQIVPQDSNDEPASELLKRIGVEKVRLQRSGVIQRLLPISPFETNETLSAIPQGWEWVRIGDLLLGDSQNGYSKKPDDALDGVPILRISAGTMRNDGIVAEEEHKLTGGISAKELGQYELQPGDLLACRFNGNRSFVGKLSLYLGYLGIKPIYPDKLIRLRLLPGFVLPKLVLYFAESSVVRKDIESYCATTVGNWGISASNLKEVKIPLPPLAEQKRIVAKVDELMAVCDRLESQLSTAQTEANRLLESVLHHALNDIVERASRTDALQ